MFIDVYFHVLSPDFVCDSLKSCNLKIKTISFRTKKGDQDDRNMALTSDFMKFVWSLLVDTYILLPIDNVWQLDCLSTTSSFGPKRPVQPMAEDLEWREWKLGQVEP